MNICGMKKKGDLSPRASPRASWLCSESRMQSQAALGRRPTDSGHQGPAENQSLLGAFA